MLGRISLFLYGAALVTVPLTGVGLLALVTGRDWGFGLQPSWVFLYLAVACHLGEAALAGRSVDQKASFDGYHLHRKLGQATALVLLAVGISGIGIMLAPSFEPAVSAWGRFGRQVVQLLIMLGFVLWPAVWTRGPARWRFTFKLLMAGAVIQMGYSILQQWTYYHPGSLLPLLEVVFTSNPAILSGSEELYLGNTFQDIPRLRGTMGEPLYLGNYLLMILPWLIWGRRWWPFGRGILVALGLLLLLTWSRGAWICGTFQVLVLGLLVLVRRRKSSIGLVPETVSRKVLLGGAAALVLLAIGVLYSDAPVFQLPRERLVQSLSTQDWSNLTRFYSMQAGWRAFLLSPLVGVGWGQYSFHFPLLVDPQGLQSQFTWPVVNNFPLKILCETGLLGFLVFLFLLGGLVWRGVRCAVGCQNIQAEGALIASLAVLGVWGQLLTFSQYNLPHIWLSVGLLLAVLADDNFPDPAAEFSQKSLS